MNLDVGRSLLRGSVWMLAMRWGIRGLGLLNTFVLARLLAPQDFGLVAMAMVVGGFIEVLGQTGQQLALIRLPAPTRADYDSVWTLDILVAVALTLLQCAVAPLAPLYFNEPRAAGLIAVLALRTLIGGFENVGVVAFRKELDFRRDFQFQVLQRLATIAVTIGLAVWLRDERALVGGILAGKALSVALSYALHPYRPRLCVTRIPALLAFSGWMLAVHIAQYVQDRADEFVVGGFASAAAMGSYSVASDVATAPTVEVVLPVTRALFPVFARIGADTAAVRAAYLDVFSAACMVSVATGLGMALVAEDFVRLALGPAWLESVPLVRVLAIAGGLYGVMQNGIPVLGATGHARLSARITASRAAATVLALLAAAAIWGSTWAVALARTVVTAAFVPGIYLALSRVLPVTPRDLLLRAWRPAAAGALMAGVVLSVHAAAPAQPALRLAIDVGAGALAYAGGIALLWLLQGRPDGLEAALLRGLRRG